MATTMGASPVMVVNGPIRDRIGMNGGVSALGQGNRANASIGRALRLVLRNVGGARPGETERSVQASPAKFTLCFPEWEERGPWIPMHVERGFEPSDSVVSVFALVGGIIHVDFHAEADLFNLRGSPGHRAFLHRFARPDFDAGFDPGAIF